MPVVRCWECGIEYDNWHHGMRCPHPKTVPDNPLVVCGCPLCLIDTVVDNGENARA